MTIRGFWIVLLTLLVGVLAPVPPAAAAEDILVEASAFVQSLDSKAIAIISGKDLDNADRERSFHAMFVSSFDVPAIGRFVLGRYWRTTTEAQKAEFLSLFEDMIVKTYSRRFTAYKGEQFTITGARADGDSAMVASAFAQPNGSHVKIDWRVIKTQGRLKIVDVMVEGVSMSLTQQQEFGAVIQRNGGQLDGLLATMRDRAQQQQQSRAARN
jgi:phospholipid transport system substrate-binding protein